MVTGPTSQFPGPLSLSLPLSKAALVCHEELGGKDRIIFIEILEISQYVK